MTSSTALGQCLWMWVGRWGQCQGGLETRVSSASSESGFPEPGHLLLLRDTSEVRIPKESHVPPWTLFSVRLFFMECIFIYFRI